MDSASDRDAKASNGDRGTPNHHGSSSSAMSVQQAQHAQAQAAAMNALGLLDPSALFGNSTHFLEPKSTVSLSKDQKFLPSFHVVTVFWVCKETGSYFPFMRKYEQKTGPFACTVLKRGEKKKSIVSVS